MRRCQPRTRCYLMACEAVAGLVDEPMIFCFTNGEFLLGMHRDETPNVGPFPWDLEVAARAVDMAMQCHAVDWYKFPFRVINSKVGGVLSRRGLKSSYG